MNIFCGIDKVVDLCAAPGSWSQVISRRLKENGVDLLAEPHLVSVDLFEMSPIEGATII